MKLSRKLKEEKADHHLIHRVEQLEMSLARMIDAFVASLEMSQDEAKFEFREWHKEALEHLK